jgi:hypothetical protein
MTRQNWTSALKYFFFQNWAFFQKLLDYGSRAAAGWSRVMCHVTCNGLNREGSHMQTIKNRLQFSKNIKRASVRNVAIHYGRFLDYLYFIFKKKARHSWLAHSLPISCRSDAVKRNQGSGSENFQRAIRTEMTRTSRCFTRKSAGSHVRICPPVILIAARDTEGCKWPICLFQLFVLCSFFLSLYLSLSLSFLLSISFSMFY